MEEARAQILDMVSRGKITVDDAEILLNALGNDVEMDTAVITTPSSKLKIEITLKDSNFDLLEEQI